MTTLAIQTQTPFAPQGLEQAEKLAQTLAKSNLIPDSLRGKPADVFVTLVTGHELGLSPMQALRGMHVINGKAVMSADLMVALVLKHRDVCEFFRLEKSSDQEATYVTKRAGSEPVRLTWTMAQAAGAGLSGKGTWKAHPAAMLRARCASALARAVYPDLVLGVYDPDEAAEFTPAVRPVAPVSPVSPVEVVPTPSSNSTGEPEGVIEGEVVEQPFDETSAMIARIQATQTMGDLMKLVPEIKTLPSERIAEVRAAYADQKAALTKAAGGQP